MDYQPSYGFLKDCLYRSESYKVTLADAYALSPHEACGLAIPPMLVLTSDEDGSGGEMNAVALVRNLHSHGVRVN